MIESTDNDRLLDAFGSLYVNGRKTEAYRTVRDEDAVRGCT